VTSPIGARRAAERWFLDHGLPSVLTPRARLRSVWPRSAPALAGFATLGLCSLPIYLLTGRTHIDIDGEPTTAERIVLGIVVLALPLVALVGWMIATLAGNRAQAVASTVAVVVIIVAAVIDGDALTLISCEVVIVLVLALTATGVGSVLGWALRLTLANRRRRHIADPRATGGAVDRPGLLQHLRVVMAATISRRRL
jgi:hypothetical protein